ncbi:MAG: DUF1080 domain-containing protein [Pirellulaceae bacterium]|nr:DUF1080 domain-containing protein [Pirellulaceae bacterium]
MNVFLLGKVMVKGITMRQIDTIISTLLVLTLSGVISSACVGQESSPVPQKNPAALIDGSGAGWKPLTFQDFVNVNCKPDTWSEEKGTIICKGNCNGGLRTQEQYTNFEMVMQWKHLKRSGNSGIFIWSPKEVLDKLPPGALPQGIEIQILDHGYAEDWKKSKGQDPDWFTTNGDVFPVGAADMQPFLPAAPNGKRSFPSTDHSKGFGEWNHYYVRAINGEIRLWVNGTEVSGGTACQPDTGFIVLEAEGAPIEFKNICVRVLP